MRTSGKVAYRKAQCLETLYLYRHLQSFYLTSRQHTPREQLQETTEDPLTKSETLTMIRAYYKIAPSIRKCLYQIVMEMSKGSYVYAKKTDDLP